MATTPSTMTAAVVEQVSGNRRGSIAGAGAIFKHGKRRNPETDRNEIAKPWQIEAYRQVNICGEARYAATLFAAVAGRAEIGVSKPNALGRKADWVMNGPEVDAFAEIFPDVRSRSKAIRDYTMHRTIAGESYLIARTRMDTDPGYVEPPEHPITGKPYDSWELYLKAQPRVDLLDADYDPDSWKAEDPNIQNPIWEIVAVTELRKTGDQWSVRYDNQNYVNLDGDDPVIRMWNPDPENRREAWSPFRSLIPTLKEIEWETAHIFRQLRSRLISAGVWFLPDNLTFPDPPADAVEGGDEAIAMMNEAERFMVTLAASGMQELDPEEVSFPTVVMGDAEALAAVDQEKLIQFWSEIDDKAMVLRSDAVRRFALGMDLPPEQVLGSSGLAVTGTSGSAGSVNHWGVWANEEQTISSHIEPALDEFVGFLTEFVLRVLLETSLVIGYDTASLRLRQDRSKEALELYDRGLLNADVTLRETGFDPETDKMGDEEFKRWLLVKLASGSASPEMVAAANGLLGIDIPAPVSGNETSESPAKGRAGAGEPRSLEDHPNEGPPQEQHDHSEAPFSVRAATCEVLVLRALEKAGHILLNNGKRGKDQDRTTPKHHAHLTASLARTYVKEDFDLSLATTVLGDLPARQMDQMMRDMGDFCAGLYNEGVPYTRDALVDAVRGL